MKPSLHIIGSIYAIGLPAIIAQALMSLMTYGLNIILGGVSEAMVTAYGLYYKIQQFILFAAFGLRDAITPIISYSHGMGNKERIRDGIKYGMSFTLVIMVVGLVAIELLAVPFAGLFGLSGETEVLCISAMRIISVSFIFAGANIAFQGVFQALNGGIESLVVSVCRQALFIFPFALIFADIAKQNPDYMWTIWTTFPIGELLSAIVAIALFARIYKRTVKA
jgi:Na+-driven multidrug efflux pump